MAEKKEKKKKKKKNELAESHKASPTGIANYKDRYDKFMESNREEQQALLVH